jgi:hypothetical protein
MNSFEECQHKVVGGGTAKPLGNINKFNVFHLAQSGPLNSVFDTSDIYPYCLLSRHCFEEFKRKAQNESIEKPLPEDLPDTVKTLSPICSTSLAYETPNYSGPSWVDTFIVVERIPVPEDLPMDSDISIVFTRKINDELKVLIDQRRSRHQEILRRHMGEGGDGESTKERNEDEWVIINNCEDV